MKICRRKGILWGCPFSMSVFAWFSFFSIDMQKRQKEVVLLDKEEVLTIKEMFQSGIEERNRRILVMLLEILEAGQKEAKP